MSTMDFPNSDLPNHLGERCRIIQEGAVSGDVVLYWMRNALRTDENPALDVARQLAIEFQLPLLVYQGLSEHYQYSSDRHHTFIMQGARDVQRQCHDLGLSYAFHLATPEDRRTHLLTLAERAAWVVTEDMPVDPPRRFLNTLSDRTSTSIVCVDTACVVPMQLVGQAYTRAFEYRNATKPLYRERLERAWPTDDQTPARWDINELPFTPIDLQEASLADWVAQCEIDHAIGPVPDTVGGSAAGYDRWQVFKQNGLAGYAKRRNNALINGVSRMSPYLHYGMVSPMRIAREAAESGNTGAKKYLDELLIWRELAYAYCFYRPDHGEWSALPDWARETLESHASDPRPDEYSCEQLARGDTKDALWNAAQHSLLIHGELHNNVRMTWGKAILNWQRSPQQALSTIIDLNHRYALDGRDPASYGGILWCLGQFDRPFPPERPIIGTVRPRPTHQHAKRLDPVDYSARIRKPRQNPVPRIAVVGAGLSGLFAARTFADHSLPVTVFEKSRGVGGRMATRRIEGQVGFDHGAQYFTVRDQRFRRYVDSWFEQGLVALWPDTSLGNGQRIVVVREGRVQSDSNSTTRYVAVPAMNSICKHLARALDIRKDTRVSRVRPVAGGLELFDDEHESSLGVFDRVLVTAPPEQSAELLADFAGLARQLEDITMNPCWATMVSLDQPVTDEWVGAFIHDSFLSWAARNSSKPGRPHAGEQLVIHAANDWTLENWERDAETVANEMLNEFWRVTGCDPQSSRYLKAHRWKYAICDDSLEAGCLHDRDAGITVCGDWAAGSRVEGAFVSGMSAAGRILGSLIESRVPEHRDSKRVMGEISS